MTTAGGVAVDSAAMAKQEVAIYVPHDLKYNAAFEDGLVDTVLDSNVLRSGIKIIFNDSEENSLDTKSVRLSDINPATLPHISEDELPLPLDDPRRLYTSLLPGVNLTHPAGYLEGGPGLDPEMDTFPDDFLSSRPQITTPAQLERALQREINVSVELLKERLRARKAARERNEQVEKELKTLLDQHEMELRIHDRMQEEVVRKKEAREKRRREREGG